MTGTDSPYKSNATCFEVISVNGKQGVNWQLVLRGVLGDLRIDNDCRKTLLSMTDGRWNGVIVLEQDYRNCYVVGGGCRLLDMGQDE